MKLRRRDAVAAVLLLASSFGAQAQDQWQSSPDQPPLASIFDDISQLGFVCEDGRLVFKYLIDPGELDAAVAGLDRVDLVFAIDPDAQGNRTNYWVNIGGRATDNGGTMFAFVGDVAVQWARLAMKANSYVVVGISPDADAGEYMIYNTANYTAKGSTAAIRKVVDACG